MSLPDKALWIIERNSTQPLTLDGIAAACGAHGLIWPTRSAPRRACR